MCIFSLKELVNYYNSQGSPIFLCYLDIRKAFDRVKYKVLFKKLLDKSVPVYLVRFIAYWYVHQKLRIRWGNVVSTPFNVRNGIRQGGLLSPYLFNLYVDKLSIDLSDSGVGCIVNNITVNHLAYADDMVLIAPSVRSLQKLLNICSLYAIVHEIFSILRSHIV